MAKRNNEDKDKEIKESDADASTSQNTQTGSNGARSIPGYLAAALRIPSSYPLGAPVVEKANEGGDIVLNSNAFKPVPGYMVMDFYPTLGVSTSRTSAVNRAAYQQFNAIRSQISGNRPYHPADLLIYQAAVDGMRHLYYKIRMIYGIISKYSATNLYRPRMCLEAMGLDADDIMNHAADIYQWLLVHKDALTPFPTVPIGSISLRHQAYNTYIFTDGDIESTQGYIMNQAAYWSYEVVDEVKGLTPKALGRTWAAITTMWDEMYAGLQGSSDVYIIAADIRRAFPDKYVTDLPDTSAEYVVEYVKLDSFLTSAMNATILGLNSVGQESSTYESALRISDSGGDVLCEPRLSGSSAADMEDETFYYLSYPLRHLNTIEANPDASALLAAVRLKPVISITTDGRGHRTTNVVAMGTEVVTAARIVGFGSDATSTESIELSTLITFMCTDVGGDVALGIAEQSKLLTALASFDWHPPVMYAILDTSDNIINTGVVEDVQNYVPISDVQLQQIFDAYLLFEFGI